MTKKEDFTLEQRLSIAAAVIMFEDINKRYDIFDSEGGFYVSEFVRSVDNSKFFVISSCFVSNGNLIGHNDLIFRLEKKFDEFYNKYIK